MLEREGARTSTRQPLTDEQAAGPRTAAQMCSATEPKPASSRLLRGLFRDELPDMVGDLVPDPAEGFQPFMLAALDLSGIAKAPVQLLGRTRDFRAGLTCPIAHCYDIVELLAQEAVNGLRYLAADIDAEVGHRANGEGVERSGTRAGAKHLEAIAGLLAQEALGHLATCSVARADKQNSLHRTSSLRLMNRPLQKPVDVMELLEDVVDLALDQAD